MLVDGFAGDATKVSAVGPGLEPEGVVATKEHQTFIDNTKQFWKKL